MLLPVLREVGLTINGGGASVTGDMAGSDNISFNGSATTLNAVGSTQGHWFKIFTGTGNTARSITINYSGAGFANAPSIYLTSLGGVVGALA